MARYTFAVWRPRLCWQCCGGRALVQHHQKRVDSFVKTGSRRLHSATVFNDTLFIFGGIDETRTRQSSVWRINLLDRQAHQSAISLPQALQQHATLAINSRFWLIGGSNSTGSQHDTIQVLAYSKDLDEKSSRSTHTVRNALIISGCVLFFLFVVGIVGFFVLRHRFHFIVISKNVGTEEGWANA